MERDPSKPAPTTVPRSFVTLALGTPTFSGWNLSGFGPGTQIDTDYGALPAQTLRMGDLVRLRSGRFGPIIQIRTWELEGAISDDTSEAQPVLIGRGRLGYELPARPVVLAPGQKLSDRQRLPTEFRTAGDLLRAGFAHRQPESPIAYVVFSFAEAEDVCAGGLWLRVEPDGSSGTNNNWTGSPGPA